MTMFMGAGPKIRSGMPGWALASVPSSRAKRAAACMQAERSDEIREMPKPDHSRYAEYEALKEKYAKMIREEAEREACYD